MKLQFNKAHFEFQDAKDVHTISYEFIGLQSLRQGQPERKTFKVYYGKNGKVEYYCGRTQSAPNQTDARNWLKEVFSELAKHKTR